MEIEYLKLLECCNLCPRGCGVNRIGGEVGYCGIGANVRISFVGAHFGEESILVGRGGSGTIFFAGCNLGCVFCQNYDISHLRKGQEVSIGQLAKIMLSLEEDGVSNINLVTPSHVAAQIGQAIVQAKDKGLTLPVVYNTGGYDSADTLKMLEGLINIYMPDMKYSDGSTAKELSDAEDYVSVNRQAIIEMQRQVGDLEIIEGTAKRGLLVRHLVLPNGLAGSFETIDFLSKQVSVNTAINVMDQYRPCHEASKHESINRYPTQLEIREVVKYAENKGLRIID